MQFIDLQIRRFILFKFFFSVYGQEDFGPKLDSASSFLCEPQRDMNVWSALDWRHVFCADLIKSTTHSHNGITFYILSPYLWTYFTYLYILFSAYYSTNSLNAFIFFKIIWKHDVPCDVLTCLEIKEKFILWLAMRLVDMYYEHVHAIVIHVYKTLCR